jgi:hypothetical protein
VYDIRNSYLETHTRFTNVDDPSPNALDGIIAQQAVRLNTSYGGSIKAKYREASLNELY